MATQVRHDDPEALGRNRGGMAFLLAMLMLSLAGIPPLAGFFAKLYVFQPAIQAGFYWLAVIGVLMSVVACFYYLRIVKVIYFDEPAPGFERASASSMARASAFFSNGFCSTGTWA
jgi:NADH-quinone oxidoreductase subunit N